MGKVAAAAASTGVLGTGGAATLVAHQLGAFGGSGTVAKKPSPPSHLHHPISPTT